MLITSGILKKLIQRKPTAAVLRTHNYDESNQKYSKKWIINYDFLCTPIKFLNIFVD